MAKRSKSKGRSKPRSVAKPAAGQHIEVISRGCLIHGSHVLVTRNVKHGYAYLPGGHVEFDESAASAVRREFLEECGVDIRVGPAALISEGAFSTKKHRHHEITIVFHVQPVGLKPGKGGKPPTIKSREPDIAFDWIDLAAVSDHDIRPSAAKAWLMTLSGEPKGVEWVSEMP
ncbi:MAG: NUDIX domain-containing protein [Phycisphaerales bacterium]|nr:NUDIX domain-containing protein [Phycisphaerales bacterium]